MHVPVTGLGIRAHEGGLHVLVTEPGVRVQEVTVVGLLQHSTTVVMAMDGPTVINSVSINVVQGVGGRPRGATEVP